MAIFTSNTVDRLSSIGDQKIRSYLYKLNEDLNYMFSNLTPEDNYSNEALAVMAKQAESVAELTVRADGIDMSVAELNGSVSSLSLRIDGIELSYVSKDRIISAINLSDEGVKIQGDKITLEGVVTANNNFKINLDGSIEAKNGRFSGTIDGAVITGSTISGKGATSEFYIGADENNNIELLLGSYSIEESRRGSMTLYGLFGDIISSSTGNTTFSIWSDGVIWGSDYYCPDYPAPRYTSSSSHYNSEDWFEGWSIQQTLIALWNCARSKGWNPSNFDPNG